MRLVAVRVVAAPSGTATVGSGRPPVVGVAAAAGSSVTAPRTLGAAPLAATGGKTSCSTTRARRFLTGLVATPVDLALISLIALTTSRVIQNSIWAHQMSRWSGE